MFGGGGGGPLIFFSLLEEHLTANSERDSIVQRLSIPGDLSYLLGSKNKTDGDNIRFICIFLGLFKIPRLWSS